MGSAQILTTWYGTDGRLHKAPVATFEGVNKNYGRVRALANFSMDVCGGELVALLGPNGAGKTTAIKLLLGLAHPTSGKLSVFGGDPALTETHIRVGAMLQVGRVPETLRVREHIDLFSSYYPKPLPVAETLAIAGLDEPTVGLDVEARHLLWQEIRNLLQRGKTVVLTTHYLEEADALADRIVVINKGALIAQGTPAEIKMRTAGKRIRCVTQLPLDVIRKLPGVSDVRADRDATIIHTSKAEEVLRQLLQLDLEISSIEVNSAGLEEAFLALTRDDDALSHAGQA